KTPEELKPSFWRELKRAAAQSFVENPKQIGRDLKAAAIQNARHTRQIMDQAQERGLPMTPWGASFAAGVSDTVEGMRGDIEACEEDLARAMQAEAATDKAIAVLEATLHMGKAALGAYALAEPAAAITEGGGA